MQTPFRFLLGLILLLSCSSCMKEDFIKDSSARLSFSADTIFFDTIFSGVEVPSQRLMVYNPQDKRIKIDHLELESGHASGFRLLADGKQGVTFSNMEIAGRDSMYIFLSALLPECGNNAPVPAQDRLAFHINGNKQTVELHAIQQDILFWSGKRIATDTILNAERPFLIQDSLVIEKGASLTCAPGVRLYFSAKGEIIVHGNLHIEGTHENPVSFRGSRLDDLFPGIPYDALSRQWGGISFSKESFGNQLVYLHMRGSSTGMRFEYADPDQPKATLLNCILKNSGKSGLYAENCYIEGVNCEFSNSQGSQLTLLGGHYRFSHCTLGSFYPYGSVSAPSLVLANFANRNEENIAIPLKKTSFNNCIIWGERSSELRILTDDTMSGIPLEYEFNNCLLRGQPIQLAPFRNCIWNEDPLFKNTSDSVRFDLSLTNDSPARKKGDPTFASEFPVDMNGRQRDLKNPDLGSREFTPHP